MRPGRQAASLAQEWGLLWAVGSRSTPEFRATRAGQTGQELDGGRRARVTAPPEQPCPSPQKSAPLSEPRLARGQESPESPLLGFNGIALLHMHLDAAGRSGWSRLASDDFTAGTEPCCLVVWPRGHHSVVGTCPVAPLQELTWESTTGSHGGHGPACGSVGSAQEQAQGREELCAHGHSGWGTRGPSSAGRKPWSPGRWLGVHTLHSPQYEPLTIQMDTGEKPPDHLVPNLTVKIVHQPFIQVTSPVSPGRWPSPSHLEQARLVELASLLFAETGGFSGGF